VLATSTSSLASRDPQTVNTCTLLNVSVGDYTCCDVAVWSTGTWELLVTTRTHNPVHALAWDPSACNEFASVGSGGSLLFWLLDETSSTAAKSAPTSSASRTVSLNVHEAELPAEMVESGQGEELTSLRYGGDGESTLYVGSAGGRVSAWDTRRNACFMHWTADSTEIGRQGSYIATNLGAILASLRARH
jgi:hypothetical protein